jgi:hypothetical protein
MERKPNGIYQLLVLYGDVNMSILEENINTIKKNTEAQSYDNEEVDLEVNRQN